MGSWVPHTTVLLPSNTGFKVGVVASANEMGVTAETTPLEEVLSAFAEPVLPPLAGVVCMEGELTSVPASLGGGAWRRGVPIRREGVSASEEWEHSSLFFLGDTYTWPVDGTLG